MRDLAHPHPWLSAAPRDRRWSLLSAVIDIADSFARAQRAAVLAHRCVQTSDREFAARGTTRAEAIGEIRDVVCGTGPELG